MQLRLGAALAGAMCAIATAQPPGGDGPPGGGLRNFGGGPPGGVQRQILEKFDKDNNKRLDAAERKEAREFLKKEPQQGRGFGGPKGGPGGMPGRGNAEPAKPGPHVEPSEVASYPGKSLYDPAVLRTIFLTFENNDWEAELAEFHNTDVEVPATLTVDGKTYPNVGVHFRGMSSYMMVPPGSKRSFNVSMDLADPKQKLYGSKTLNLLNCHEDATFLSTALYSHVARQYIPAPKSNVVKVVVNGESWGVYANVQQFNKEFLAENFKDAKGARWKVRGSPMGGGGLEFLGAKIDDYRRRYEIKSADDEKSWKALIALCRTLNATPPNELEAALKPMLDIDGVLWFLALDVALINCDGYWIRASDYSIYRDSKGIFHAVPHDMNEAFRPAGGPGLMMRPMGSGGPPGEGGGPPGPWGPGGPGAGQGGGVTLDPLTGLADAKKPLRSKLLAVPKFREQYLRNLRTIAEKSLAWESLGPVVANYRTLLEKEIELDTRKLTSLAEFRKLTDEAIPKAEEKPRRGPGDGMNLHAFAEQRRAYLLDYAEIKNLPK